MDNEKRKVLVTHRDVATCNLFVELLRHAGATESDVRVCINDPAAALKELEEGADVYDLVVTQFDFGWDSVGKEGILISDFARAHGAKVIMISDAGNRDRRQIEALGCRPDALISDPPSRDEVERAIDSTALNVHAVK